MCRTVNIERQALPPLRQKGVKLNETKIRQEVGWGSGLSPPDVDVPALRQFMELAGDALEQVALAMVHGQDDDPQPGGDGGEL